MIALKRAPNASGVVVANVPEPVLNAGEAMVRPTRAAIAPADLGVARGEVAHTGVMGHQFVGVVERVVPAAGREDQKKWEGKRVAGGIDIACGSCERCRGGLSAHCASRRVLGLHGWNGCFAERFALPVVNLVEVPASVEDDRAIFALDAGAALHVAHMLRFEGKTYVSVIGDDARAMIAAQVLTRLNASVRVLGRAARLSSCERWGIKHRAIEEVGLREDQDVVVECTGTSAGISAALRMIRPRGKVVLMGGAAPVPISALGARSDRAVDLAPVALGEIDVMGARGFRVADALVALQRRDIDVAGLISKRLKLGDGVRAFEEAGRAEVIRIVLEA